MPYQWRSCWIEGQRFLGRAESLWGCGRFGWGCWGPASWQRCANHLETPGPTLGGRGGSQRSHNVDWLGAISHRARSERQNLFAGVRKLGSEQRQSHKLKYKKTKKRKLVNMQQRNQLLTRKMGPKLGLTYEAITFLSQFKASHPKGSSTWSVSEVYPGSTTFQS